MVVGRFLNANELTVEKPYLYQDGVATLQRQYDDQTKKAATLKRQKNLRVAHPRKLDIDEDFIRAWRFNRDPLVDNGLPLCFEYLCPLFSGDCRRGFRNLAHGVNVWTHAGVRST
jgi:hypothetical protein